MSSLPDRILKLTLPAGERLDRFLAEAVKDSGVSRSKLQKLIAEGRVTGIPAHHNKSSFKAKQPTEIEIRLSDDEPTALIPFDFDIPVLFEDEYLAVVHKPAGMTVHPGAGTGADTMVHALIGKLDRLAPHAERPGIVHRLDRETEGLLLVAKTDKARTALSRAFAGREVSKEYAAIVWGQVKLPEVVEGFITRDTHNRRKMRFSEHETAGRSRAREAILEISEQSPLKFATRLSIALITGRTHQIRATAAYFNAPIVGDTVYGNDESKFKLYNIGREKRTRIQAAGMLLMAQKLSLKHPFKRKTLDFALPLPKRFEDVVAILST